MKQYSFLNEANWADFAHNTIGGLQRSSAVQGMKYGALAGMGVNTVKNAMKKDGDPTKKGTIRAALSGAAAGSAIGGAAGFAGGRLARSGLGQKAQGALAQKAAGIEGKKAGMQAISHLGDKAYDKAGNLTSDAQKMFNAAHADRVKQYSIVKGAGSLTKHGINKGRFLKDAGAQKFDIPVQG